MKKRDISKLRPFQAAIELVRLREISGGEPPPEPTVGRDIEPVATTTCPWH